MKTITLWNVPVDVIPQLVEVMNKQACQLLLEKKFDDANDIIYSMRQMTESYNEAMEGDDE